MNVLHILEATGGGTRRHLLDLLPALSSRGVNCTFAASPVRGSTFWADTNVLTDQGVTVIQVTMARGLNIPGDALAVKSLGEVLAHGKFDLIHCHSSKAGLLGRLARVVFKSKAPLVYTPHCIAFDTGLPLRDRRAARIVEKILAPLATHIVTVSDHERRAILSRRLCPAERVTTIYNGVDIEAFDALEPRRRSEFGLEPSHAVIGCFGRLTRQKGQHRLLKALPLVLGRIPQARLLVVGGGEDEPALRTLARKLGIENQVVWTGEQHDARPIYALCDAVIQPSLWEGCPYSVLEAMAASRIVAASAVGGVTEILDSASGIAYDTPRQVAEEFKIAQIALRMLGGSGTARSEVELLGIAARRRVVEKFSLTSMVDKLLTVYSRCLP